MAPKRKKQQVEEEEKKEETTTESPAKKQKLRNAKVDSSYGSGKVYNDGSCVYDCMLNQTNIAKNNNKFYVIQLIEDSGSYVVFTRWGRVGENGQTQDKSFSNTKDAIKEFCAKFKSKTANNWADRDSFTPKSGKYTMVDIADDDEEEEVKVEKIVTSNDGVKTKIKDSALEPETQELINLIFSNDMFKEQLVAMNIDVEKMPLGKLSKEQIKKGFQALEKLKTALDENDSKTKLAEYTSAFYTVVPHNFGRKVPPVISSQEALKQKVDLLNVLSDMTIALEMKNNLEKKEEEEKKEEIKEIDNPIDQQYKELNNTIKNVDKNSELYKILETYYNQTKGENKHKLLHIYSIDREGEKKRHDIHKDITNRKLLWHGTNVAVVCAILKTGLRIMPHSGGRVGKGIYFASENAKSAGYVGTATDHKGRNIGIMFLNEVALGKIHQITKDDSSLKAAPEGYDSILAKGQQEPDESKDTTIDGEYGKIIVPQGKPKETHNKSSFYQSEYLVYQESQVRMKYLLMFQWERGW